MSDLEFPNLAVLLGPFIEQVPEAVRPRFLALLERGAAERYRGWAAELPEHAEALRACADREDEIAERVERLYPADTALREQVARPLPAARDAFFAVLAGLSTLDQMRIQANAERQGAAAWRSIASLPDEQARRDELEKCARLEETSATCLDAIVGPQAPGGAQ